MRRAADNWAEWKRDSLKRDEVPDRLALPDPWQFLLDAPAVPEQLRKVCRAAQSQLWAWRRIGHMRMGFATLNTDLHQKAMEAKAKGDQVGYTRAIAKFANRVVVYAPVQEDVRTHADDPKIVRQMEHSLKIRRAQLVHRGEGQDAYQPRPWPSWNEFAGRNKLPVALVQLWVRFPERLFLRPPSQDKRGLLLEQGTPGLMFFRNEALTEFLKFLLAQENLTPQAVKKVRQRLRLIPVEDKRHLIWAISIKRRSNGDWDMKLGARNEK
jgi:hypothetical protein